MVDVLNDLCREGTYVAVYGNSETPSKFMFGRILCVGDTRFAMLLISPNGEYDGIVVDDLEDIIRVAAHGKYHEKMMKLICPNEVNLQLPDIDESHIDRSVLIYAKETNRLVSIELEESGAVDVCGFVEEVSEATCKILEVDEYGFQDGDSVLDLRSISQISMDSADENRVMKLYRANYKAARLFDHKA